MSEKRIHPADTLHYSLVQGSYFIAFCAVVSCATVFLLDRDFTSAEVGTLLALANLASLLTQSLLADFIDRNPRVQLKNAAAVLSLVSFFALVALLKVQQHEVIGGLFFLTALIQITLQPFVNTLGVGYQYQDYEINFGAARSLGSLVFSLTSFLVGILAEQIKGMSVIWVSLVGTLLFSIIVWSFRKCERVSLQKEQVSSSMNQFIRNNQRFMVLLLGMTLACSAHMLVVTFLLPVLQHLGGGSQELGIALFLSGILEIPSMFLFRRINRHFSSAFLLKVSGIAYMLKSLMILGAGSIWNVYAAQVLQMFSYALFIPASVRYTESIIAKKDQAKGQACIGIALSASGVIGCFIGGIVLDLFGITVMLGCGVGFAALGAILIFLFADSKAG